MANPFYGVILNGRYYRYVDGSWTFTHPLRNQSDSAQNGRVFTSVQGSENAKHTITLELANTYDIHNFDTNIISGSTTWKGVSRKADFLSFIGGRGASMPILFSMPEGTTVFVVPTGALDWSISPITPSDSGIEYRVTLTLEEI